MSDPLGLSVGTTNLVAARVGSQPVTRRAMLTLPGAPVSGSGAIVTGFVDRVGDAVPIIAGDGTSYDPGVLLVTALDAMVDAAGASPASPTTIATPAYWRSSMVDALRAAIGTHSEMASPQLVSDAVAALTALRANPGLDPAGLVMLLDFGGGGTTLTLADPAAGFRPVARSLRYREFSGEAIDQSVLTHVLDAVAHAVPADPEGTAPVGQLTALRAECRRAKEQLSADTAASLTVDLPRYRDTVRLTRAELERMIQAPLAGLLEAVDNTLERNRVTARDLSAIALVGGGASIPLVAQRLSKHTRARMVTTPMPSTNAAVGAAVLAAAEPDPEARTGLAPIVNGDPATDPYAQTGLAPAARV